MHAETGQEITDDILEVENWISDYDKFRSSEEGWAGEFLNDYKGAEQVYLYGQVLQTLSCATII